MLNLISFLIMVLVVLLLSRLVSRWLALILPARAYKIILWPGVVVHEFSHLLGAVITFTKVTGFSLLPKVTRGVEVLGSLSHKTTNNPIALIAISLLPFLGGSFVLWLLSLWLVPSVSVSAPTIIISNFNEWWLGLWYYLLAWWNYSWELIWSLQWNNLYTWIFVYLALAIGAHLAPSNKDLQYTTAGLTALSLLVILVTTILNLVGKNINIDVWGWVNGAITFFIPLISYSLALLLIFSIIVGLVAGVKRLNNNVVWWG